MRSSWLLGASLCGVISRSVPSGADFYRDSERNYPRFAGGVHIRRACSSCFPFPVSSLHSCSCLAPSSEPPAVDILADMVFDSASSSTF